MINENALAGERARIARGLVPLSLARSIDARVRSASASLRDLREDNWGTHGLSP